jgi:outer membrane protein assembly factor BamE (lipoprotein component of BamABCDE complex)
MSGEWATVEEESEMFQWMKAKWAVAMILLALVGLMGCSVYMASTQPDKKNLDVLKAGTPRSQVIAELGTPTWAGERDGSKVDVFAFKQGYSTGAKVGRALFHGVADIFTVGLWEAVGTPTEMIASGTDMKLEVAYDKEDRVKEVKTLTPEKKEEPPAEAPKQPMESTR